MPILKNVRDAIIAKIPQLATCTGVQLFHGRMAKRYKNKKVKLTSQFNVPEGRLATLV